MEPILKNVDAMAGITCQTGEVIQHSHNLSCQVTSSK